MPPDLPTAEQIFGAPEGGGKLTSDDVFGPEGGAVKSGPDQDSFFSMGTVGHVLNAFGQGAKQGWGQPIGPILTPETEKSLRDSGVWNDYEKTNGTNFKAANEAWMRPAASALDSIIHAPIFEGASIESVVKALPSAVTGLQAASAELGAAAEKTTVGHAIGAEQLGQAGAEILGYETSRGDIQLRPFTPADLAKARSLGAVGEGEAGYFDAKTPAPEDAQARSAATKEVVEGTKEEADAAGTPEGQPAEAQAAPDVHSIARQIAPETFQEYDALATRRDQYRSQLADMATQRAQLPDAVEAQGKIDTILSKVNGVEDRLTNAAANRLDAARDDLAATLRKDTPEMADVRKQLLDNDFRMRDLAPDVAKAYRDAEAHLPEQPAIVPETVALAPQETAAPEQPQVIPAEQVAQTPEAPKVAGGQTLGGTIAQDVSQKLVAAGRPAEEADAAAALVQAHYEARAQRFGGKLGSAQELYARDAPNIKGAGRTRALELAQGKTLHQSESARAQTETPEFKNWFGESKVVDKGGSPIRLYHGTTGDVKEFSTETMGKFTKAPSAKQGFFFTDRPKFSDYYAGGDFGIKDTSEIIARNNSIDEKLARSFDSIGDKAKAAELRKKIEQRSGPHIVPVYLSIQNPLIHDFKGKVYRETSYNDIIDRAKANGHDGVILKNTFDAGERGKIDALLSGRIKPENIYVAFKPEQIKSATGNAGTFDKENPSILAQGKRGSITLGESRNTIKLFKNADASTFLHEVGHQWLEELMHDAADENAPADVKSDAEAVHTWLGTKSGEAIPTKAHEKFARGFERYLMEGVAPSKALASVFAKFRAWLTQIYQTVNRLRSPITDDIRAVFDRLITANPERTVIAPERAVETSMADIHEAEAEHTPPERATPVADHIDSEIEAIAKQKVPNVHAAITGPEVSAITGENADIAGSANEGAKPATEASPARTGTEPAGGNKTEAKGFSGAEYESALGDVKLARGKAPSPRSLFDEIRSLGGIKITDNAGKADVLAGDVLQALKDYKNPRGVKRLINNETGKTLDYLREALTERGWLGRNRDVGETDINELLNAIGEEAQGSKVHHPEDEEVHAIEARRALDEELGRAGVTASDSPHFAAVKLANWRASEDAIKFADEQEMAAYEELSRLEPADYERLTSHGYEPGSDLGTETERPDEHLGPSGGIATDEGPESSWPDAESARASETGGQAKERPTGPNDNFAAPESDLVDKAGNIVLDNLNTNEDVKAVLRQVADMNDEFLSARRGVVSDADVLSYADAMGVKAREVNLKKLRAISLEDGIPLAARIRVGREMLIQSAQAVHDAMQGYDEMAYAVAAQRHLMIQETLSAITAEVGRGLRAFRSMGDEATKAQNLAEFIKENTGRTLNQLKEEMAQGKRLDTPAKVSGYLKDARKPSIGDMLLETFKNWLISGPITHTTYSVGNSMLALWKAVPETAIEAAVGAIRGTEGFDRVRFGEVGANLYGLFRGQRNGVQAAWDALKAGQTMALPGEETALKGKSTTLFTQTKAVPGIAGQIIRAPGERMVAPIHSYFRSIGYAQSIAGQVYRAASEEGLRGAAFDQRVAELTKQPTPEMMAKARDESTKQTLMGKGGELTKRVSALMNWEPKLPLLGETKPFAFIDPFVHIASNIVEQSVLERSPLGLMSSKIREDLRGTNGEKAKNETIARMAAGTALSIVGGGLAMEGLITPSEPSDPREAAMWRRVNGMPHAARFGDVSIDLSRLGVLGFQLGIAADLYHAASMMAKEDKYKIASLLVHSFTQNFLDEGFMRGPSDLIKALDDNERYGASYVRNFVSTIAVPFSVGMSQVARQVDPYSREARTTMDAIKAKIPWVSETLMPRRDIWGEPMPNRDWIGTYSQQISTDPVDKELMDDGIYPSKPLRKIRGVDLTDQQYDDYCRQAGRMAKMQLNSMVGMAGFSTLPVGVKQEMIKNVITASRENARSLVMMQNPQLIQKAIDLKTAPLTQQPEPVE